MSPPEVRLAYAVAGWTIASDRPIPALSPLRSDRTPDFTVRHRAVALPAHATQVFDAPARLGIRTCRVRSLTAPDLDLLQVSGAGTFAIGRDGIDVDPEPGADGDAVDEALLGPALALALARRGVFVLHAGAVVLPDRGVVAFLGDSGAGKSTLARLLVEAGRGVALAADDLLAVDPEPSALPHFPQLKLDGPVMSLIAELAPRCLLRGLFLLEPAPPAAEPAVEALSAVSGAAALLRHTIAGRLFAQDLLTAHLGFAAELASRVPPRRLAVPRRLDIGPEVLRQLDRTA